jgi:hypothetical protein
MALGTRAINRAEPGADAGRLKAGSRRLPDPAGTARPGNEIGTKGERMRIRRALVGAAILCSTVAPGARAVDGVLEIDQTCALAGCFPGDTAGFPVTTGTGSYRLTSDLVVPDTTGVFVATGASLDLNGFAIRGGGTCTGEPVTSCAGSTSGSGISTGERARVHGGHVQGFTTGVAADNDARLFDLQVSHNSSTGVQLSRGASLRDSVVVFNGGSGVTSTAGGGFGEVVGCTVRGNALNGVTMSGGLVLDSRLQNNGLEGLRSFSGSSDAGYANNIINGNNGAGANVTGGRSIGCNVIDGAAVCP